MNSKVDFASGGIAIDKDRVLIVKNKPHPTRGGDGYWGFPKGHLEEFYIDHKKIKINFNDI